MQDVDSLVKLGDRLERCDKILFFFLFTLNHERELTGDHNFIEARNQESEAVSTTDLRRHLAICQRIQSWLVSFYCVTQAELAVPVGSPAVNLALARHKGGMCLTNGKVINFETFFSAEGELNFGRQLTNGLILVSLTENSVLSRSPGVKFVGLFLSQSLERGKA